MIADGMVSFDINSVCSVSAWINVDGADAEL